MDKPSTFGDVETTAHVNDQAVSALAQAYNLLGVADPKGGALSLEGLDRQKLQAAMSHLHQFIVERKQRMWSLAFEKAMKLYGDIAVRLIKQNSSRDVNVAIRSYAKLVQQINPMSLHDVAIHMLTAAEKNAETVKKTLETAPAEEDTPEEMVLRSAFGETVKERLVRRDLNPALQYFHDVTQSVLHSIKQNIKFEGIYQTICQRAFEFYARFKRSNDFQTVVDLLRRHVDQLLASTETREFVKKTDVFEKMVQTRYLQLDTAMALDAWYVAYSTLQDIDRTFKAIKNPMKISLLIPFYERLTKLFWTSRNYIFHAFVQMKLARGKIKFDKDCKDREQLANGAALAILCIPITSEHDEASLLVHDLDKDKAVSLAKLLGGGSTPPSRATLINDLTTRDVHSSSILNFASPNVQALFRIIEDNTESLRTCHAVKPILAEFEKLETSRYIDQLKTVAVSHLIVTAAQCFERITVSEFMKLSAFYEPTEFISKVEPQLVAICHDKRNDIALSIDVAKGQLEFKPTFTARDCMTAEMCAFQRRLNETIKKISAPKKADTKDISAEVLAEEERIRRRTTYDEKRQALAADRLQQQKNEEKKRKQEELEKQKREEMQRLERQRQLQEKEQQRKEAEAEELERRKYVTNHFEKKYNSVKLTPEQVTGGQDQFVGALVEKVAGYKRSHDSNRTNDVKMMDHLERAIREIETPRRMEEEAKQKEELVHEQEERMKNQKVIQRQQWEQNLANKQRFERMTAYKLRFEQKVWDDRAAILAKKKSKMDEESRHLEQEKARKEAEAQRDKERERAAAAEAERARAAPAEEPREEPKKDGPSRYVAPARKGALPPPSEPKEKPADKGDSTPPPQSAAAASPEKPGRYVPPTKRK